MSRLIPYLLFPALLMPARAFSQVQNQPSTINIGLLVPDSSDTQLIRFAEQAVVQANRSGGYQNREFKLVVRSAEGLWGTGSKESVALVYEDEACAMVGSLDGRNAHLAEQVAAKSHLCYLEAHATDPTLSQAFVPWFMRLVPNDDQQAQAMAEFIGKNGGGKCGILSTETYDARHAIHSLTKALTLETGNTPVIIDVDELGNQERKIIEKIQSSQLDHLVVPFDAPFFPDLLVSLGALMPSLKTYGTLYFTMGAESREIPWKLYEGMYVISAGPVRSGNEYLFPDARDAFAYDGVDLVIQAIKQVGTDREKIKDYLLGINYDGKTGTISFDELGNRTRRAVVAKIVQGKRLPIPY